MYVTLKKKKEEEGIWTALKKWLSSVCHSLLKKWGMCQISIDLSSCSPLVGEIKSSAWPKFNPESTEPKTKAEEVRWWKETKWLSSSTQNLEAQHWIPTSQEENAERSRWAPAWVRALLVSFCQEKTYGTSVWYSATFQAIQLPSIQKSSSFHTQKHSISEPCNKLTEKMKSKRLKRLLSNAFKLHLCDILLSDNLSNDLTQTIHKKSITNTKAFTLNSQLLTGQPGNVPFSHFFSNSVWIFPKSSFWSSNGFTRSVYSCRYSRSISRYLAE